MKMDPVGRKSSSPKVNGKKAVRVVAAVALIAVLAWLIIGVLPGAFKADGILARGAGPEPNTELDSGEGSADDTDDSDDTSRIEFEMVEVHELTREGSPTNKITAIVDGERAWSVYIKDLNPKEANYIVLPAHDMESIILVDGNGIPVRQYPVRTHEDPWFLQGNKTYLVYGVGGMRINAYRNEGEEEVSYWVNWFHETIRWRIVDVPEDKIIRETSILETGYPIDLTNGIGFASELDVLYVSNLKEYLLDKKTDLKIEVRTVSIPELKVVRRQYSTESQVRKEELLLAYFNVGFGSLTGFTSPITVFRWVQWSNNSATLYVKSTDFFEGGEFKFSSTGR